MSLRKLKSLGRGVSCLAVGCCAIQEMVACKGRFLVWCEQLDAEPQCSGMSDVMRRWLVLFCSLCLASSVFAQKIDLAKAKRQFLEAQKAYKAENYDKALELYQALHEQTQDTSLLFNIAQCERLLKHYEASIAAYEAYLKEEPKSPYADEIAKQLVMMREALAKETPTSAPSSVPASLSATKPNSQPVQPVREEPLGKKHLYVSGSLGLVGLVSLGVAQQQYSAAQRNDPLLDDTAALQRVSLWAVAGAILESAAVSSYFLLQPRKSASVALLPTSTGGHILFSLFF